MAGQRPHLGSLTLCNSAENVEASSLVSYATCASSGCSPQYHILASEDMAADCHGVWRKLTEVQFVPGWTSCAGFVQETFMQTEGNCQAAAEVITCKHVASSRERTLNGSGSTPGQRSARIILAEVCGLVLFSMFDCVVCQA